jgi:SAM-dependent methyltransferase
MLALGARVAACDYSNAVDACARTNDGARANGRLVCFQADVFALPIKDRTFDLVLGYGMLQHTGDPDRALQALWSKVRPDGALLVDRYKLSARHFLPFKYALRPITSRLPPKALLAACETACEALVPLQRKALRRLLAGNSRARWLRYAINRSPNSVFPLNLEIAGKLSPEFARQWSVLDTFDQYAPKYDRPCTGSAWREQLEKLEGGRIEWLGTEGQGNVGVVRRYRTAQSF